MRLTNESWRDDWIPPRPTNVTKHVNFEPTAGQISLLVCSVAKMGFFFPSGKRGNLNSLALSLQRNFHRYVNPYWSLLVFLSALFKLNGTGPSHLGNRQKAKPLTIMHLLLINHPEKTCHLHCYMKTRGASSYLSFSTLATPTKKRAALSPDTDLRSVLAFFPDAEGESWIEIWFS